MTKHLCILLLSVIVVSCSPFQKALKSDDVKVKYETAEKLYERGKYIKAIRLFEQIVPSYKGKPQAEKMFYMYAHSLYKSKQYYTAGYQFEYFSAGYPRSEKLEETSFLSAKSYYMLSPRYSLDQKDTYKALDKLQLFINNYPNSEYMPEANQLVKELRQKLEKKDYEVAMQFYKTAEFFGDFGASIRAFDNFIIDHPGTDLKEEALFYKFDASYKLAMNSVAYKMQERLENAKGHYRALIKFNGESKYKAQADEMLATIDTELQKFSK